MKERERNLVVGKKEEVVGDSLELVVDGTQNGGYSVFHGSNSRSQRSRVLLCEVVEIRHTHKGFNCRNLHKPKMLQFFLITLVLHIPLHKQHNSQINSMRSLQTKHRNRERKKKNCKPPRWWPLLFSLPWNLHVSCCYCKYKLSLSFWSVHL